MCWWVVRIVGVPILAISLMLIVPGYSPFREHTTDTKVEPLLLELLDGPGNMISKTVCDNMCENPNFRPGLMEPIRKDACSMSRYYMLGISRLCEKKRKPMNFCGVQSDLADCFYTYLTHVGESWEEAVSAMNSEMGQNVHETLFCQGRPLTVQQKKFVKNKILKPACHHWLAVGTICTEPEYRFLTQANLCQSDFMKFEQAMMNNSIQNFCKNEGSSFFDALDANLHKCSADMSRVWKSPAVQKKVKYYYEFDEHYERAKLGTAKHRDDDDIEGQCDYVRTIISIASDVLLTSCEANPKPGQIIWNAFNDTLNYWRLKCGGFSYETKW